VYEDYPFDEVADENATAVLRHKANRKSFALIMRHQGRLYLNLKCEPMEAEFLRRVYSGVLPGYHMNKTHWNTIVIGGDVPRDEMVRMIRCSYELTKPKTKGVRHA
jgi:predicted DNA-binding protein (MmcQ/YjbR family)